jgi:outer membrane receptor protein involved in Fe transport
VKKNNYVLYGAMTMVSLMGSPLESASAAEVGEKPDVTADAPAPVAEAPGLATVVVTAQKRTQNINDVGESISTFSADELRNRQINSVQELANAVPGLSYADSPHGTPVYTLRGVGYNDPSLAAAPAVSVYIDQAPLPFPALSAHSQFDLERVEILKGPQGTLFGSNSTGGAINYIAAKPTSHFEAGGAVTYGRFNENDYDAHISGPLADDLSARLAVRVERAQGWQQSMTRPGDTNGAIANYMGRLLISYDPVPAASFLLNVTAWKDDSDTQALQLIDSKPAITGFPNPLVLASPLAPRDDRAADWTPGEPRARNRFFLTSLRGDFTLPADLTLTSLTAYENYHQRQAEDEDGLALKTQDNVSDQGEINTIFEELRLSNGSAGKLRWVVGANYQHSHIEQTVLDHFGDSETTVVLGASGYPIFADTNVDRQVAEDIAAFVNGSYDVTDQITIQGGARYTQSNKRQDSCSEDVTPPYLTGAFFYDVFAGGGAGKYVPGQCYGVNNVPASAGLIDPPPQGLPGRFVDKLDQHNISWRGEFDWKPARNNLLYVSVSRGYKEGGFPALPTSTFVQYLPVTQESVTDYEGGFKSTLLDGRIQVNGAGFYYDYKNKQLEAQVIDPVFGPLEALQNVPKASIKGGEIEVNVAPATGLTASLSATYLDATVDKYIGVNDEGLAGNFAGTPIPFAPKFQLAASADYEFPLPRDLKGFVGTTVSYRTSSVADVGGNEVLPTATGVTTKPFSIDGYTLVDFRGGIQSADDRWRVSLFVKNAFNTYYWTNAVLATDSIARFTGRPTTYGMTVSFKYR